MNGKITFVGAGPGAVDLITLRGAAALDEAELVVYAGSLVNEKLLERAAKAELVNSAKLSLPEVIEIMAAACRAGIVGDVDDLRFEVVHYMAFQWVAEISAAVICPPWRCRSAKGRRP